VSIPTSIHRETRHSRNARAAPADWQRSLAEAIRTLAELLEVVEIDSQNIAGFQPGTDEFPLLVPRSFAARMRKGDPGDPLLRQVLPDLRERLETDGFGPDPLREIGLARHGVLEKYAGRALLVATQACPVHCRYCFRRHFPYSGQLASRQQWAPALNELRRSDVSEVILSGGDPLSLSNRALRECVVQIEQLESVHTLRIHSRFPIILPERIDRGLVEILTETRLKTVLVVHCNHVNEIDDSVRAGLSALRSAETLLLNQSVLLSGVNDAADTLAALSRGLFDCGVLPYYLHLLDPVAGAAHFDVPESRGRELTTALRQQLPGYLVPRLVREDPGAPSKTVLM
jgi:EF-P beta-lysylation protein EpmB